jgi:hypothetical protein
MRKPISIRCLDAAYGATTSLLFLFNWEMMKELPDVYLLALAIGYVILS